MSVASISNPSVSLAVKRGVLLVTAGALLTPLPDAIAKVLGETHGIPAGEIALARFAFQSLTILPFLIAWNGWAGLQVQHLGLNLLRGMLMAAGSVAFFAALKAMPLADAIAIFFVQPMIVTILSIVFLKEPVDIRRIAAVLVGFGGALLVIRPNFSALGMVATLPLVCALCFAIYLVLGRHLSRTDSTLAMHFYTGIGGAASLAIVLLLGSNSGIAALHTVAPSGATVWFLLVAMSILASIVHLIYIQAYRLAPAGLLAPFSYFEIVSAAGLGFLMFRDFPDLTKTIGMAIIIASGLALIWVDRLRSTPTE